MENTNKAGIFSLPKIKILWGVAATLMALVLCRGPIAGGSFPAAASFITYMVSAGGPVYALLLIPASAGLLTQHAIGYDIWDDLAAITVCCLFFVAAKRIGFVLWQKALIAASASMICTGIYRMATVTVYKTSVETLTLNGLLVFLFVFVFAAVCDVIKSGDFRNREWETISLTITIILTIHGLGVPLAPWIAVLILGLWSLWLSDVGMALLVTATGSTAAALIGQSQWGFMAAAMLGIVAASFAKQYGAGIMALAFAATCWLAGNMESGVVLEIDPFILLLASTLFFASEQISGRIAKIRILPFAYKGAAGARGSESVNNRRELEHSLEMRRMELEELELLYATYLDSRAMLAGQLGITKQIIDDIRWRFCRRDEADSERNCKKFEALVAVSQCAASGAISGDCCGWQELEDGRLVMVISDGMGKGKRAAAESLMVTRTILTLLKAGAAVESVLKLINTIMLTKEDADYYATVDLAVADLKTGKARFYKIGAAPTLIRRGNRVEEVNLSTIPLGIVNGLKIRYMETSLKDGDWIIMMSDGVSDGGEARNDNGAFLQVIREAAAAVRSSEPQAMSDLILNRAADSYIGRERDDLTALAARIQKQHKEEMKASR